MALPKVRIEELEVEVLDVDVAAKSVSPRWIH